MIFHINAVATFLVLAVAATTSSVNAKLNNPTNNDRSKTCYDYSATFGALGSEECRERKLFLQIRDTFKAQNVPPTAKKCKGGLNRDIMALTSTSTMAAARQALHDMCKGAKADAIDAAAATTDTWAYLEDEPYAIELNTFFEGGTFLNDETGNFRQTQQSFEQKGRGSDRFNYMGEDVRLNDHYPTSQDSYMGGQKILKFNEKQAKLAYLSAPTIELEGGCPATNTAVCCWHRDRQYFDGDGNCFPSDCANQTPGDNTDLCWTEGGENSPHPYPGSGTEGNLHCHGFAWSTLDETAGDVNTNAKYNSLVNTNAKWNNLFHISMYDHLYTRGYVNSITDDPLIMGDEQAICGCAEDMSAKVARADCTEAIGRTNYTASLDFNGLLSIAYVPASFYIHFRECQGFDYDGDITPTQYEEDYNFNYEDAELKRSDNDLSAFVFRQYLEGNIDKDHVLGYEKSVIGYRNPLVNKSDEEREKVCAEKFIEKFPNDKYEQRTTTTAEL